MKQETRTDRPGLIPKKTSYLRVILGTLLVLAGLAAALVTVLARQANQNGLAGAAAVLSLLIALLLTIFIVPPLARSARVEVASLDVPFEPTSGGGVFLVIIIVVGFAAWNTGNNLLFLVFSLLMSTLFVGWIAARSSLRDLNVSARFPDHIFAAEPAPVIVTLRNTKRVLPSFSILVEARGPSDSESPKRRKRYLKRALAYFSYVPHSAAAEQRVEQLFPARGHVLIDGFELSTRFPFGFFRRRRRLRARNVDIIVYPKPEVISDKLHLLPMYAGRIPSLRRGAGHDLFSMRDYQPQDDLRHIDWKATARSRRLTVRQFTSEDERRITIVLDTRLPRAASSDVAERFERGVVQAASLIKHFIDERAEVRLVLGDEVGPFGSGVEQLYRCLRRLALVTPQDGEPAALEIDSAIGSTVSRDVVQHDYAILLTAASPGTIPSSIWRTSHVIYL
ncbi:MAG TPA: DUF58 domain-containing protein [Pyrinomonadaceae bacterium]|nr:DUF58 domain-containing protein [Pyrinomonadaceae bacterium]